MIEIKGKLNQKETYLWINQVIDVNLYRQEKKQIKDKTYRIKYSRD
jgi:hypothetical protein